MRKADKLRGLVDQIAGWRLDGRPWPQIARDLGKLGVAVSADEVRSYWPRLSRGRTPSEVLQSAQATVTATVIEDLRRELDSVSAQAAAAQAEVDTLRQRLASCERALAGWTGWAHKVVREYRRAGIGAVASLLRQAEASFPPE